MLQAAERPESAGEATPPLVRLQALTGCTRREAQWYLQQVLRCQQPPSSSTAYFTFRSSSQCSPRGCAAARSRCMAPQARFNLQAAVIQWHNQVLRDYLSAYQATFPGSVSFKQQEVRPAAATCTAA